MPSRSRTAFTYKYLALSAPPECPHASRAVSALVPYEGYLLRRWAEDCQNDRQLWREFQAHGQTELKK